MLFGLRYQRRIDQGGHWTFTELTKRSVAVGSKADTPSIPNSLHRKSSAKQVSKRSILNGTNDLPALFTKLSEDFSQVDTAKIIDVLYRII